MGRIAQNERLLNAHYYIDKYKGSNSFVCMRLLVGQFFCLFSPHINS